MQDRTVQAQSELLQALYSRRSPFNLVLLATRLIYFSKTFSIWPTFLWILPASFSPWPLAARSGLFVTRPAFSLTLPFTSRSLPLIWSVVLGFMVSPFTLSIGKHL